MSFFAKTVMEQKYSHVKPDGTKEDWNNIAYRVSKNVLKAVHASKAQIQRTHEIIRDRKFIPGGRYLAATGRLFHQVNNCYLFRAPESHGHCPNTVFPKRAFQSTQPNRSLGLCQLESGGSGTLSWHCSGIGFNSS